MASKAIGFLNFKFSADLTSFERAMNKAQKKLTKFGRNIQKTGSVDSGYGVIADKTALAALTSVETRTERQRDASLRATEIVMTADYGVFELDDTKGAPILFEMGE